VALVLAACSAGRQLPSRPDALLVTAPPPPRPPRLYGDDVVSLRVKRSITARFEPNKDAKSLGVVGSDTYVKWISSQDGAPDDDCDHWVQIAPRGWICDKYLEPSKKPPGGPIYPPVKPGELVPGTYGYVTSDTVKTYKSAADVARGKVARTLDGAVTVRKIDEVQADGRTFWKTSTGELIDAAKIEEHHPSTFAGVDLRATTAGSPSALPIAWAQSRKDLKAKIAVRKLPQAGADVVRKIEPRTVVPVVLTEGDWSQIGDDEWVANDDLHIAREQDPPDDLQPGEKWIDVDEHDEVLVAYEDHTPVFATMVSTGGADHPTPVGVYRVWLKFAETDMKGRIGDEQEYSVATVPWTMFFAKDLALHAAYWHDQFGKARSHGCVNLAPADARWLYFWATPDVPDGWTMVQGILEKPGAIVRVRDGDQLTVEYRGYATVVRAARRGDEATAASEPVEELMGDGGPPAPTPTASP
jgi:hypothetical protein